MPFNEEYYKEVIFMYENKLIKDYTYATRFIMSWVRMGGQLGFHGEGVDEFKKWLTSLNLEEDDIAHIVLLATNGKMELEISAKKFLANIDK